MNAAVKTASVAPPNDLTGAATMPALQRRRLQCYLALMLADIATLFAKFALGGYVYLPWAGVTQSLLLAPLMLAMAVAIRLEDGGPVLFIQHRVGRGNRFFSIYKFRSMTRSEAGRDGAQSTAFGDACITRIGQMIRATSIDELPQLFNVLKGDMSLVGPRPHAIASQTGDKLFWQVDERYWQRHALKSSLTGLAQIRGLRGATDHEQDLASRLNADLEYLRGWSIWRDLSIVLATLRILVRDRAY